jgi:hypothetical protein
MLFFFVFFFQSTSKVVQIVVVPSDHCNAFFFFLGVLFYQSHTKKPPSIIQEPQIKFFLYGIKPLGVGGAIAGIIRASQGGAESSVSLVATKCPPQRAFA